MSTTTNNEVLTAEAVERVIAAAEELSGNQIIAVGGSSSIDLYRAFDLLADAGLHESAWHPVWERAAEAVHSATTRANRSEAWENESAAADAMSAAAVAEFLRRSLSDDDYRILARAKDILASTM